MRKRATKTKKLTLSKEQLRVLTLTREQLGKVAGGVKQDSSNQSFTTIFPSIP